ncbi:MAG: polyprenyl synthetase family protein [Thermoanaerobaculia bacterium]
MSSFADASRELRPVVDAELDRLLPPADARPARLHEAMRYSVFAGGKRVRPLLVLLAGGCWNADRALLLPGAAAVELIHTFSLVHDDLPALDDDDLRRGRLTAHRQYDEATAVLVGDGLLALGLQVLAERPASLPADRRLAAVSMVAAAVGTAGMIGGQMDDVLAEDDWPEEPAAALESIHARKTGALLTACLRLGGLYAGCSPAEDHLLTSLGADLGLMFQIADDILDIEGSAEQIGKSARKDVEARKLTYPALHGLEASRRVLDAVRLRALERVERLPAGREVFASLVDYLSRRDR